MTEKWFERRSYYQIINDILVASLKGSKVTRILQNANLSYKQFETYIPLLGNFVNEENGVYTTNNTGIEYIRKFKPIKDMLTLP